MGRLLSLIYDHWLAFTVLLLLAITLASLWPLQQLPSVPGSDKLHHVVAYAALMFPVALRKPNYWLAYGLLFAAYSGAIELVQPHVNRYGEWADLFANTAGLVCGVLLAEIINRCRQRARSSIH